MVRQLLMRALWSFILVGFGVQTAVAEVAKPITLTPREWGNQWLSKRDSKSTMVFTRVIALKRKKSKVVIQPIPDKSVPSLTLMETPTEKDITAVLEINKKVGSDDENNPCLSSMIAAAMCFGADAVIDITEDRWVLHYIQPDGSGAVNIKSAPEGDIDKAGSWLSDLLNYDGEVLEVKRSTVLARIPRRSSRTELQGLTLENSEEKMVLPSDSSKGTALITSTEIEGNFGIFTIIAGNDQVTIGTKLILEKSNKKKQ